MSSDRRPRLRPGLRFIRRVEQGVAMFVVKDPVGLRYYRFREPEAVLMRQMDGTRSPAEIADALRVETGIAATPDSVAAFARRLKEMGLVERTQEEKRLLMMEMLRRDRKLRLEGHGNTLLRMRFSLGDPDRVFDRVLPRLRFLFTPAFVVLSGALFVMYGVIVAMNWGAFVDGLGLLYDPGRYTAGFVVMLYGTAMVIFGAHELGHGLTCKHFGGEVHEIGAMLFYFSPAFFCNINDAWTFEKRAHRLWVTFAGGWIQLVIGALAAITWIAVEPGTLVHDLAFIGVILGGGLILVLNFNPLIPLDGYYALMDWLEIPNLRPRSFAYIGAWFRRRVLRMDTPMPAVTARERRALVLYGVLALVYTTLVLTLFFAWIGGMLTGRLGAWGWPILALLVWLFVGSHLRSASGALRAWITDRSPGRAMRRRLSWGGLGLGVLVLALLVVPWTTRAEGAATVEAVERLWLRPPEAARVEAVDVVEGARVAAGEPLLRLRSLPLEIDHAAARAGVGALENEVAAARAAGETAALRVAELALAARREEAASLEARIHALVLRAPFDAVVVTPRLYELAGRHVAPGDTLIELWREGPLRARITLTLRDAGGLREGLPVRFRFPSRPGWTWRSRVAAVGAAARDGGVEVLAPLGGDVAQPALRAGMVGRARVDVGRTSLAGALVREVRRTFRTDWLL